MSEPEQLNGHAPEAPAEAHQEPVPLESADQVVYHMANWHNNRMGQLLHAMHIPPEIPVEVTDHKTGEVFELNEEQMVGFRAGLSIAISIFEQFPIQMIPADQPEEQDAPEAGQGESDDLPN